MNPTLLKDLILAGHRVACETHEGNRKVFLFVNGNLNFEGTQIQHSVEASLSQGLDPEEYDNKDIEYHLTGEYKIVTPLPQLPQVGDTVEVLEICRELPGFDEWGDDMKDMVGGRFKVKSISDFGDIRVYTDFEKDYFTFSSRQVAKCEPEKEQSIQSGEQFGEIIELNGRTYKAI